MGIDYLAQARGARPADDPKAIIRRLNTTLPGLWLNDYLAKSPGSHLPLEVTPSGKAGDGPFISYWFDLASQSDDAKQVRNGASKDVTEDRVIVCWGVSRAEPGSSRDKSRIGSFLKGVWSTQYKCRDRGHLFAHTMGGGMDINLVPQLANINRDASGIWRRFEIAAAANPGSFAFVRPIYKDRSWTPSQLEWGLFFLPPDHTLAFEGGVVDN